MNKKVVLVLIFFISISLFANESKVKFSSSISYSHSFSARSDTPIAVKNIAGGAKIDSLLFFKESNVGLGFAMTFGGPYNYSFVNDSASTLFDYNSKTFDLGFNFYTSIGIAFDFPLTDSLSFNCITGPSYELWLVKTGAKEVLSNQLGGFTSMAIKVLPSKNISAVFGMDGCYSFYETGFVKSEGEKIKINTLMSSFSLKPFVGLSFRIDKLFFNKGV